MEICWGAKSVQVNGSTIKSNNSTHSYTTEENSDKHDNITETFEKNHYFLETY